MKTLLVENDDTMLIDGTLWENLTLGNPDAKPHLVWSVCRTLGLSEHLLTGGYRNGPQPK